MAPTQQYSLHRRNYVAVRMALAIGRCCVLAMALIACREQPVDFATEVKPILNKRCISCHGGVKRSGNFSLLFRHEALDTTEHGKPSIIPFDAGHSEMIRRMTATDPEVRMPYKEEALSPAEIEILTRWIDQGAAWGDHWAYVAPAEPVVPVPGTQQRAGVSIEPEPWAKNAIDHFVLQKLDEFALQPSPEAPPATLMRRAYLDLTGLPPTPAQAAAFLGNNSPDAYERLLDTLLASPRFGEKWASWWLDLARYADTKGYERDAGRNIWRYRDWVIKALNADMPFDQFTTEQLAGDLLPEPTDDQLIATAFHRNTMNNDEGGTEDEEFRVAALIDRVGTTWEIWQSTTMACVQCHTHPYDPFVHDEYYASMAFFNNTRDEDTHGEHPNLRTYTGEDERSVAAIREWVIAHDSESHAREVVRFLKTTEPKYHPHDFDAFDNSELIDTKWLGMRPNGSARIRNIPLDGIDHLLIRYGAAEKNSVLEIRDGRVAGPLLAKVKLPATTGGRKNLRIPMATAVGTHDLYFVIRNVGAKPDRTLCDIEWFAFRPALPGKGTAGYAGMDAAFAALLEKKVPETPVTIENTAAQRRTTHVFERGNWLVKGRAVSPAVPESLNPFPTQAPANRLGFAQWLLDDANPLTARSMANRIWEQLFGVGIVETLEDFGTQGAPPSHPALLDWLALRLREDYQWHLKPLIKTMMMSATYRQDSRVTPESLAKDPLNRWLSRGARVRLSAEQVRDQALAVAGLLSDKMYGPSVMPFQPAGIWNSVWSGEYWKLSEGDDQYRRSVYTYTKRTSPYPAMIMFDGASREVCVSRRIRTNTPLQALVTLNDSTYVVAARQLAKHMEARGKDPEAQLRAGYSMVLARDLPPKKLQALMKLHREATMHYQANPGDAAKLLADAKATPDQAALTLVSQAILNLDEVITKE